MNRPVTALCVLALTMTLADCAKVRNSRLNPFNWFRHSETNSQTTQTTKAESDDGRQLIDQVTQLAVSQTPTGAIVQATGLPPSQGWWKADLVADNHGLPVDGVVTYRFLVYQPVTVTDVSTPQSRELTAAAYITNIRLQDVTEIVVLGANNSRTSKR